MEDDHSEQLMLARQAKKAENYDLSWNPEPAHPDPGLPEALSR